MSLLERKRAYWNKHRAYGNRGNCRQKDFLAHQDSSF